MDAQGIEYYELEKETTVPLRQYYRTDTGNASNNTISAALRDETDVVLANGAYVVPMDQVASSVIAMTFEPDNGNNNAANAAITSSTTNVNNGLALVIHDLVSRNYPYYRLEKDNPREVLPDKDKKKDDCKEIINDIIEEVGCNASYGYLVIAIFAVIPFILRNRKY
jgi:hypothetical protein